MAAKKAAKAKRKNPVKQAAKKKPAKKAADPCPDHPDEFFSALPAWADQFSKWAFDIETCFETKCGGPARKAKLIALCKQFSVFAKAAKVWADDVESCFQANCVHGPVHTLPPNPPF